ncbi:unnamed protein product [Mytilus edulis]|uniref:Cadherin domain-containing protein n=1 Tax=Mytilus edulis TaxID=6550 RepID=A0A8S3RCT2_MYTED|nr:unnamed protein product [Mytilus edulis]
MCLVLYVNDEEITELCGIPDLSETTKLVLHVFNRDNFVPEITDIFNIFSARAVFKNLILPPPTGALCRYGDPFRGGSNPIIKYEVGIGSDKLLTDIEPFRKVIEPCIPCFWECLKYNCDQNCDHNKLVDYSFTLTNLNIAPYVMDLNETGHSYNKSVIYYLTGKAVTGSGDSAVSSSSGFYIDITGPVFDLDIMLNSPIYSDETEENFWAIGKTPGGQELQEFQSVGLNVTGVNSSFEGILQHNHTYYVSIICVNGGGKTKQWNDTNGVTPLFKMPEVDTLNNTVLGEVKPFDEPVIPSDAMESTDPDSIGFTFTVSEDKSINKYDLCIGTDKNKDDIFPCVWVGYNVSGSASIKDGYLLIDNIRVRPLSELQNRFWNVSEDQTQNKTSVFHMEPGRTLFLTMRVCNEAELCTNKSIGSVLITNTESILKRSDHGESIEIVDNIATGSIRRKRSVETIVLTTPEGLIPGQTIVLQPISEADLTTEYRSDSSTDFQPYIVNPATTLDMVERLLYKRIHSLVMTFSVIPVGHLPMPGPMNITYPDTVGENEDNKTVLAHWNTALQQWQLSGMTCGKTSTSEINNGGGTKTVEVCKTWTGDEINNNKKGNMSYFSEETQFAVFIVSNKVYNTPPILTSDRFITMEEDEGTIQYQLEAFDEEGDVIKFSLASQTNKLSRIESLPLQDGLNRNFKTKSKKVLNFFYLVYDEGYEVQTNEDIPPASSETTIVITIIDYNDSPEIFLTQHGQSILSFDPSEPVLVTTEPCVILPHEKESMSWIYTTLTYTPVMNVSGYDLVKLYVSDSLNASSAVVTIQFVVMKLPCHNDGSCDNKLNK